MDTKRIDSLREKVKGLSPEEIIALSFKEFGQRINFASSLGAEDQVITDMIAGSASEIEVFTLDTGRLFDETYELLAKTQKRYPIKFKVYYPDTKAVEDMVESKGVNLFYDSVENRKLCCGIRKVEPLKRALSGVDAWIAGLRRAQSLNRSQTEIVDWDEVNGKIKINPLAYWSKQQLDQYIKDHKIDINPLHEKGFLSIGCSSCTRAVKPGEDERAGRWWWEGQDKKECGLHNNA